MASANTGPPWFADSSEEAGRAQLHYEQERRRLAFRASQNAKLQGNPSKALTILYGFTPLKESR